MRPPLIRFCLIGVLLISDKLVIFELFSLFDVRGRAVCVGELWLQGRVRRLDFTITFLLVSYSHSHKSFSNQFNSSACDFVPLAAATHHATPRLALDHARPFPTKIEATIHSRNLFFICIIIININVGEDDEI